MHYEEKQNCVMEISQDYLGKSISRVTPIILESLIKPSYIAYDILPLLQIPLLVKHCAEWTNFNGGTAV